MSAAFALPQELKDPILQHLSAFPSTFASCALAHRTLTATAQSLLFRAVHTSSSYGARAFLDSVTSSPHLASYVDKLVIAEIDELWVGGATSDLLAVIDMLPNLTALAMRCALGSAGLDDVDISLNVRVAPLGTLELLERCASRMSLFELDFHLSVRNYSFEPSFTSLALRTLVVSRHIWHRNLLRDWLRAAPNIRRLVLWVGRLTAEAVKCLRVTGQGLVHDNSLWAEEDPTRREWLLGPSLTSQPLLASGGKGQG